MITNEIKNKIYKTKKWEEKAKREDLKYRRKYYRYDFQQYEAIRFFGWKYLYTRSASIVVAEEDQSNLLKKVGFNNKSRLSTIEGKDKKNTYESVYAIYEGRHLTLNAFKLEYFQ